MLSCKKIEFKNDISGIWNILNVSGGLYPHSIDPHFTILQIKKNYHYFVYRNDTLISSGNYDLYNSNQNQGTSSESYQIQFNKGFITDKNIAFPFDEKLITRFLSVDTVILSEGCCDTFDFLFARHK